MIINIVNAAESDNKELIDNPKLTLNHADVPQFCGGFPYFFRGNPYQSVSFQHTPRKT